MNPHHHHHHHPALFQPKARMLVPLIVIPALLASSSPVGAKSPHPAASIKGLHPDKYDRYVPSSKDTFTCLSGSGKKTIPFSAVNDDYCDCEDGSDEPGTSACRWSTFYCHNKGHIPASILSSRVGDGICDPECCDGSDESEGVCPDVCVAIGQEFRAGLEEERKRRKTGSKIRSSYIAFAEKEKKRLEADVIKYSNLVKDKEREVEKARQVVEEVEQGQGEMMEKRKNSPLYTSLLAHRLSLSRLRSRTTRLESELDVLKSIFEDLVRSYNPNYQDMAVRAAAMGYMEIYHDGKTPPAEGSGTGVEEEETRREEVDGEGEPVVDESGEGEEKEEEIKDEELEELEKVDLMGLLVGWEDGSVSGAGKEDTLREFVLYNLANYIPDPLLESYDFLRSGLLYWLIKFSVVDPSTTFSSSVPKPHSSVESPQTSAARQSLNSATISLSDTQASLTSTQASLSDLATKFGPKGEWKKLDGTCIEKNLGEYTYELCFFGAATQKGNKGGGNNSLGRFNSWNYDSSAEEGTEAYYSKQLYDMGAKCWNGPHRSVKLQLYCAKENELLSVVEAEKCEYVFTATSPALCWPEAEDASSSSSSTKDEL
ncbi:glucosidase II beta subunit-like-domain-containing protein [Mrakia frigida]|uniref:Gtb1p n=1 Tax=Mrakia frigida TaxID=29902 RepID=UPI003FCC1CC8